MLASKYKTHSALNFRQYRCEILLDIVDIRKDDSLESSAR